MCVLYTEILYQYAYSKRFKIIIINNFIFYAVPNNSPLKKLPYSRFKIFLMIFWIRIWGHIPPGRCECQVDTYMRAFLEKLEWEMRGIQIQVQYAMYMIAVLYRVVLKHMALQSWHQLRIFGEKKIGSCVLHPVLDSLDNYKRDVSLSERMNMLTT